MIDKKNLKEAIANPLEKADFSFRGQTWYINGQDVLIVINLQKSSWDDMNYMNIGFWLKGLGEPSYPSYNHCHLYFRLERLFPEQSELILTSCSLEKSNIRLLVDLSGFIEKSLVPFLKECTKEEKLKELMAKGELNNGIVLKEAKQYLL
jgi:hypothetical protein